VLVPSTLRSVGPKLLNTRGSTRHAIIGQTLRAPQLVLDIMERRRHGDLELLNSLIRSELLLLKNDANQFEFRILIILTFPLPRFHHGQIVNLAVSMPLLHLEYPIILGHQCTMRVYLVAVGGSTLLAQKARERLTAGLHTRRGLYMAMIGRGKRGRGSGSGKERC